MARDRDSRAERRSNRRRAGLVALGLLVSLGAASALAAVVSTKHSVPAARSLTIGVDPSSRTVAPGASARYAVKISRPPSRQMGLSGRTRLWVAGAGLPAGVSVSFDPQRGLASAPAFRQALTLTVTTTAGTPAGTYTLRVKARRPRRSGTTAITLIVSGAVGAEAPPGILPPGPGPPLTSPEAFTIAGVLSDSLSPGYAVPLDLTLTNLESTGILISSLVVEVASVNAPQSNSSHPCGTGDFAVAQFAGTPGVVLPASGTVSLGGLGFAPSQWPKVSMLNPPVNQDGCKGASLALAFSGTATEVTP